MFVTSTSYTYNRSPDTAVDAVATEFSGSTNRKDLLSKDIHCPSVLYLLSYSDTFPD
jgi:hypothetical protein